MKKRIAFFSCSSSAILVSRRVSAQGATPQLLLQNNTANKWICIVCFTKNWTILVVILIHKPFVNCSINGSTFQAETLRKGHLDMRNAILIVFTHFGWSVAKWWDDFRLHQYKHNRSEINSVQIFEKLHLYRFFKRRHKLVNASKHIWN